MQNFFAHTRVKHAVVFGFYLFLALALTYPLIFNFQNAIPGDGGDNFIYLWSQWWVGDSIVNFHSPFATGLLLHPLGANLVFSGLALPNSIVAAILQIFFSPVVAFNLVFIAAAALAAFSMFLLLRYLFSSRLVAVFGGAVFAFNVFIFQEMAGHFNYTNIYAIPLFILFFLKIFKEEGRLLRQAGLAGLFLTLAFYNDFYYTIGLLLFAFVGAVHVFFKDKQLFFGRLKPLVLLFLVWLALGAPLLYLSIKGNLSGNFALAKLNQINLYTPDIRSFLIPPGFQTIFGKYFENYYFSLRLHSSAVYLGFSLIILSLLGYFFGKKEDLLKNSKFWFLTASVFFFFSLGPFLFFDGYIFNWDGVMFTIPLPYLVFYALPFVSGILVPPRFIIFVYLALAVLGSFAVKKILCRLGKSWLLKIGLIFLVTGLFLLEHLSIPISISPVSIPKFYQQLEKEPGDFSLLELPFALSTSFYTLGEVPASSKIQYYQSVHRKKILSGWIARVPDNYYQFYSRLAGLDYLIDPNKTAEAKFLTEKPSVIENFKKLDIKYLIIHPEFYNRTQLENTLNYLEKVFQATPQPEGGLLVYKLY